MIGERPDNYDRCVGDTSYRFSASQPVNSCVANSTNASFYSTDLWSCVGNGCQEWLDEAHCILNEGYPGHPSTNLTQMLAEGLIFASRYRVPGIIIGFNAPPSALGIVVGGRNAWTTIDLSPNFLADRDYYSQMFLNRVTTLVHEYWHIVTKGRGSIENEISAFNMQTHVGLQLGYDWQGQGQSWRMDLLQYGLIIPSTCLFCPLTLNVTNDDCEMCQARDILLTRFPNSLYSQMALRDSYFESSDDTCSRCP